MLDKLAQDVVDKILSEHCEPDFWEGLGEPFSTAFKTIATDIAKCSLILGANLGNEMLKPKQDA